MSLKLTCSDPACGQAIEIAEAIPRADLRCPRCGLLLVNATAETVNLPDRPAVSACSPSALPTGPLDAAPLAAACSPSALPTRALDVTPLAAAPAEGMATPARIGRFEIGARLGEGAFGIVYRAYDTRLEREVALKVAKPQHVETRRSADQFLQEAKAAANLRHPNIIPVYDSGEDGPCFFIATAFIAGHTLQAELDEKQSRPFDVARAVEIIRKLAEALAHAHEHGIVHCDVKPSNVMIDEQGHPLLADFGLARRQRAGERAGSAGTPAFMAPEQWDGRPVAASDQYSLGVTLYKLLTGTLPFLGNLNTVRLMHRTQPVPPPRKRNRRVSRDLAAICLKCLEKEPGKRYADCTELADDLRRFQEGWPVRTRPTPLWEQIWKWAQRRPALASLVVVSFFALLSLVLFLDQRARAWQRDLREQQRASGLRDNVQRLFFQTEEAVARGELQDAQGALQAAAEIIEAEPPLANLQPTLAALRQDVAHREAERRGQREADRVYRRLFELRDAALLASGLVLTGLEIPANLTKTKEACREALAMFGVAADRTDAAVFSPHLPAERRRQCAEACYELLLIWADAEAQPEPGRSAPAPAQLEQAVRLVDRAVGLDVAVTGVYHLRRAGYLEQQGDGPGARRERQLAAAAKLDALDYFLIGDSQQKQRRLAEAAANYGRALHLQPNHFWAHYFLAMCQLQMQQPGLARENLTACLMIRDDFVWLYLLRGFAYGQLNDFPAAEDDFEKALARHPGDQQRYGILVNQGNLRLRQAQLSEPLVPLSMSLPFTPNVGMAFRGAAEAYRLERLAAAAVALRDAVRLKPDQFAAYRYLAMVSQEQKQLDEANDLLGTAIKNADSQVAQVRAQLYGQRARLHQKRNEMAAALGDLDRAVATFASAADHIERGKIMHARGHYKQALAAYDAAIGLQPNQAAVYRLKADALMALEQFDKAARALDEYLAKNGQRTAEVFRVRASAHARLRQHVAALADYTQALALVADSATYAARGWVHLAADAQPLALQDFAGAIRLDPKNAEAYAGRAMVQALWGRRRAALDDVESALRNRPAEPRLLWNVAHVYAQLAADAQTANARSPGSRTNYQVDGVTLLRQALAAMPAPERVAFWRKFIEKDPLLNPLRDSPAFEDLERDYGNAPRKRIFEFVN